MYLKKLLLIVAIISLLLSIRSNSYSATDGQLGVNSTGTVNISLTIPELFRISHMEDPPFGTYSGFGDLASDNDLCVFNNGDGSYGITISDSNTTYENLFALENVDSTFAIPLSVRWNDKPGTVGNQPVNKNSLLRALSGANTQDPDCATTGKNANMQFNISEPDLQSAPVGSYSCTINVVIESD